MLEKIGMEKYRTVSQPCKECLELIELLKMQNGAGSITFAEIGIGVGATAVEAVKLLSAEDSYYMFSFESDVNELKEDLLKLDLQCKNIYAMGNTAKPGDSYSWTLAKLLLDSKKELFDLVYLDGAHAFIHDSSACCVLKKLTKVGGFIIFDDIDWCHAKSPTANPEVKPETLTNYTMEQINTCQVKMVVDIFMQNDPDWEMAESISTEHRVVYKRLK